LHEFSKIESFLLSATNKANQIEWPMQQLLGIAGCVEIH
jgi:hypothetical protein